MMGRIDDHTLQRLVYRSVSRMDPEDQEGLAELVRKAQGNNARTGLTGCLALAEGRFVQVLEGDSDRLQALMEAVIEDRRHCHVDVLANRKITARLFKNWGMTRVVVPPASPELLRIVAETGGAAHVTGILLGLLEGSDARANVQDV